MRVSENIQMCVCVCVCVCVSACVRVHAYMCVLEKTLGGSGIYHL